MFRTVIEPDETSFEFNLNNRIISLGSCFADTMGARLSDSKFNILVNPFGIVFNPLSIFELLELSLERSEIIDNGLVKRDGQFFHYKLHSSFSNRSRKALLQAFDHQLDVVREALYDYNKIILTFGSAYTYRQKDTQLLVSNCHKMPQQQFEKSLLTVEDIVTAFFGVHEMIKQINPKVEFILTVSPIRHTKESLTLNSVSKSVLRLTCHYLSTMAEDVYYYPAYEIVMDDLRDYRFFEKDMIHPNEQAVDYIWNHFSSNHFDSGTRTLIQKWDKICKALNHKPFNPKSSGHQAFLKQTLSQLEKLSGVLDVEKEIEAVKKQIL